MVLIASLVPGMIVIITTDNYRSLEAEREYSTNSQRKMYKECVPQWVAYIAGDYVPEEKRVFDHGNYVDAALTEPAHVFKQWKEDNKHKINGKYGRFKDYDDLDLAIKEVRNEPLMMKYLRGDGQAIIALDNFHGTKFKMKLDCLNLNEGFLADLKTCKSIHGLEWVKDADGKNIQVPFYDAWDYWTQIALYREGVWEKYNQEVEIYLVVVEKKPPFDRAVFDMNIGEDFLEEIVGNALISFQEMQEIKDGDYSPDDFEGCGICDYCVTEKKLLEPEKIYPTFY